jgi:hypothetical protein
VSLLREPENALLEDELRVAGTHVWLLSGCSHRGVYGGRGDGRSNTALSNG